MAPFAAAAFAPLSRVSGRFTAPIFLQISSHFYSGWMVGGRWVDLIHPLTCRWVVCAIVVFFFLEEQRRVARGVLRSL